jgi:hypothetical protein
VRLAAGESVDVQAPRLGLLAVALGLVDGPAVLQPLVEERLDLGAQARLARLARVGARDLARAIPDRLAVSASHRHPAQPLDRRAIGARGTAGHQGPRRSLVEGRELVWEPRHRASDAGAAGDHAAPHVIDRATLGDVALNHRPPAADIDQAFLVAEFLREGSLLVVPGPRAMAVNGLVELPSRAAELVELRQRADPLQEHEHSRHHLGEVVSDRGAARDVDDGDPEGRSVVLAQEVHQAHRTGHVAGSSRDPAPGGAGPDRDGCGRGGAEALEPARDPVRLIAFARRIEAPRAHRRVVALILGKCLVVGHRALEDDDVRRAELALGGVAERAHELGARGDREDRVVKDDLRQARNRPREEVLHRGRCGTGDRDRAAVAAHPRQPKDVDLGQRAVFGAAQAADPPRGLLAEDRPRVGHLLELQGLHLRRQRLSSSPCPALCIVHIARE